MIDEHNPTEPEPITQRALEADLRRRLRPATIMAVAALPILAAGAIPGVQAWLAQHLGPGTRMLLPPAILAALLATPLYAFLGRGRLRCPECHGALGGARSYRAVRRTGLCPHCSARLFHPTVNAGQDTRKLTPALCMTLVLLYLLIVVVALAVWLLIPSTITPLQFLALSLLIPYMVGLLTGTIWGLTHWGNHVRRQCLGPDTPPARMVASSAEAMALCHDFSDDPAALAPFPNLLVLGPTGWPSRDCFRLYSTADAWCLAYLGSYFVVQRVAAMRKVPLQAAPWQVPALRACVQREALYGSIDFRQSAWLSIDPRNIIFPRAEASCEFHARRSRRSPYAVGILALTTREGAPQRYTVVSPLTDAEVEAILRGKPSDPTRTVYETLAGADASSMGDAA